MAPEMMTADSSDKLIDVYSYAVMLYCLFGRQRVTKIIFEGRTTPITDYKLMETVINGTRPQRLPAIPPWWSDFIELNWSNDPSARLTFDAIVGILDDDPEATFPGVDDAEYKAFREKYHSEITAPESRIAKSRSQDAPILRSMSDAEAPPQPIVERGELPAEFSRSGPGKTARKPFNFDK